MLRISLILLCIFSVGCSLSAGKRIAVNPADNKILKSGKDTQPYSFTRFPQPNLLKFEEILTLASRSAEDDTTEKLEALLHQPLVDNSHYLKHGLPKVQHTPKLGDTLRVATWNIEKSLNIPEAVEALKSESAYLSMLNPRLTRKQKAQALRQRERITKADILILQEIDIGHCRSGYRNNAAYIAKHLGMNYVYGTNQLEVNPEYLTGRTVGVTNPDCEKCPYNKAHRKNYKGLFGCAVLSKFPIKRVQLRQLDNQIYDWYTQESESPDLLEKSRRFAGSLLFQHKHMRELKLGGRSFLQVDLHIPQLPLETLSIVNVHLEIKAPPKKRKKQMQEILESIKGIKNPVIMAGDFNSSPYDVAPISMPRALKKFTSSPSTAVSLGLARASITGLNESKNVLNYVKNYRNPLASHVIGLAPNHQHSQFRMIRDFRFDDGGAFDFRGDKSSTMGRTGVLSNSNQRHGKGYKFTFNVPRPIGPFGREKLDWFFVKSFLTETNELNGSKRMAPHYGEVLNAFNRGAKKQFSDHSPMVIDLPIF